jgi:uncharacterized protein YodC (DUF2158 family)
MEHSSTLDREAPREAADTASYRTGDVVVPKSGGRPMTATWVGPVAFAPGTWLICEWLDAEGETCLEMFDAATLKRALTA